MSNLQRLKELANKGQNIYDPIRILDICARVEELEAAQASWGNEFSAVCMAKQERDELKEKLALALSDASIKHKYRADALEKERDELAAYAEALKAALEGPMAYWKICGYDKTSCQISDQENVEPEYQIYQQSARALATPPPAFLQSQREKMERLERVAHAARGLVQVWEPVIRKHNGSATGGPTLGNMNEALRILGEA